MPSVSALAANFNREASQPLSSAPPVRPRTPASALPPRARTPVSPAPPRPRTPVSAAPLRSTAALRSPFMAQGELSLISPTARRPGSPSLSATIRTRDRERNEDDERPTLDRERSSRAAMGSPAPPPRSTNRPSSVQQQRPLLGVPRPEG